MCFGSLFGAVLVGWSLSWLGGCWLGWPAGSLAAAWGAWLLALRKVVLSDAGEHNRTLQYTNASALKYNTKKSPNAHLKSNRVKSRIHGHNIPHKSHVFTLRRQGVGGQNYSDTVICKTFDRVWQHLIPYSAGFGGIHRIPAVNNQTWL